MPKIRDLGINVIPSPMRPLNIGDGGGGHGGGKPEDLPSDCPVGGSSCKPIEEELPSDCPVGGSSCKPEEELPSDCPVGGTSCRDKESNVRESKAGLSHHAIAQLRQQLETHIGM